MTREYNNVLVALLCCLGLFNIFYIDENVCVLEQCVVGVSLHGVYVVVENAPTFLADFVT